MDVLSVGLRLLHGVSTETSVSAKIPFDRQICVSSETCVSLSTSSAVTSYLGERVLRYPGSAKVKSSSLLQALLQTS